MIHRLAKRAWVLLVLTPTLVMLSMSRAAADSDVSRPAAALSWMDLHDSRGISIWDYDLSLDRGGITSPLKMVWSVFADIGWHIYTWLVGSAMWLIDFTLSFGWLEPFERPAEAVSDSLADVITRFGALPVILTLAGVIAAVLIMAGRFATGLYEFFAAATIAALAVGVLASPIHYLTGSDSWLVQARDLGLEVGGSLSADRNDRSSPDPDEIREDMSQQLADIFIRAPHQLVNYNAVIDGTDCESAYDAGLRMSHATWVQSTVDGRPTYKLVDSATGKPVELPEGTTLAELYGIPADKVAIQAAANKVPEQRSIVANCDPALGDAADNPSFTQVINTLALGIGGIFLAILALALCLAVWASAIYALILAIKALWNLITGILPGGQRLGLTRTISEVIIALIVVLAAVIFLMAYLQVVTSVFNSTEGPPMKRFAILDLLLIGGIIVWLRMRKALKRAAEQLARKMAARPNSKPTKIGSGIGPARTWATARRIGSQARQAAGTGGRAVVVAGRHSRTAAGAGGMAAFAGVWGVGRVVKSGSNWSRSKPDESSAAQSAAEQTVQASATAPPDANDATASGGRGPDNRPPRHSEVSLARERAIRHRLETASRPGRQGGLHSGLPSTAPREPAAPPVRRPARPAPEIPDVVVRDGHRARSRTREPDKPTRVPL
ncbi:MAG TPA: hypothetical protein VEX15_10140 [Nocardioidaceae bacterium]|nr:hypothetical protein [Nocardioidaceae bacterium]